MADEFLTPDLKFHEAASMFPLMEGEDFDALVTDIKVNGLREPIMTLDGKILDGRNRYRACEKAGVAPTFLQFTGKDPLTFVISMNLKRRHLTVSQRAMAAAKVATLRDGENKGAQGCAASQADAAKAVNVSRRQVQKARVVRTQAKPEDVRAVERGEKTIDGVLRELSRVPPPPHPMPPHFRLRRTILRRAQRVTAVDEGVEEALREVEDGTDKLLRLVGAGASTRDEAITTRVGAIVRVLSFLTDQSNGAPPVAEADAPFAEEDAAAAEQVNDGPVPEP